MSNLIAQTLGPYRIIEQIGIGGMATVYKAYQPSMDRYVAIKVLPAIVSRDPAFLKRFRREAKVVAKLEHKHILPVHDYGEQEGLTYLVMRYVEAGTLKDRLAAGQLDLPAIYRIIAQVGAALDYAHRLGVIHRDVKPTNVLIDSQGDAYLTDFGLARIMESSEQLTATGVGVGTPAYMAPEQGQGLKIDHRSDIYSLGVMLYEMAAGRVPYEAETPMAVVIKHITAPLPLPSSVKPDISPQVERVILKAMAKDPDDRFQTVGDMVAALDAAMRRAQAEAPAAVGEFTVAKEAAPPSKGFLARAMAGVREATQTGWGRTAIWAALGVVALLAFFLALSRVPLKVQIRGGQLEVVRVVEATITPEATVPTTTPVLSEVEGPTEAGAAKATATPKSLLTATPTPTRTPGSMATPASLPTATPIPRPSVADQVRAFAEPILAAIADRPPDYKDDFSDPGSGWSLRRSTEGEAGYEDGEYVAVAAPGYASGGDSSLLPELSDVVLEIDVRFVSGDDGNWAVGLRRRWENQTVGYGVMVRPSRQEVEINRRGVGEKWWTTLTSVRKPFIKPGYETNHLQIIAKGPQIAVAVNGEWATLVADPGYTTQLEKGRIRLDAGNEDGGAPLRVHFDNLKIWIISDLSLSSAEAPPVPLPTVVPSPTGEEGAPPVAAAPTLTPMGRIVYSDGKTGNDEIYVANSDGSDEQRLTDHPAGDWLPAWSPDGTRIVFTSDREATHAEGYQLYLMNADGSNPTRLTTRPDRNAKSASWSPDGSRIAFHSYCDLMVIDADGSNWTTLIERREDLCPDFPTWAPDGRRIAFRNMTPPDRAPPVQHDIYVVNDGGSGLLKLATLTSEDWSRYVVWSPDGSQVAFDILVDDQERYYAVNSDGNGEPVEISSIPDSWYPWYWPQWAGEE